MRLLQKTFAGWLAACILLFCAFTVVDSSDWKIASGYSIRFSSEDPNGVFTKFGGDIAFDPDQLETSKFNLAVETASISTGNGMKNRHAKSGEWLDAEKYPTIRFVSKAFSRTENGYEVTGILDLHGVQKEIAIPFTFEDQTFKGTFTVNRTHFNIGKTTGMYGKVSTELKIDFAVPVTK